MLEKSTPLIKTDSDFISQGVRCSGWLFLPEDVENPLFEMAGFFADNLIRRRRNGANIQIAPDNPLGDALGRRDAEHAGGVLGQGDLPRFLENQVQRRQGFGGVDFVLVPELAFFPLCPVHREQVV